MPHPGQLRLLVIEDEPAVAEMLADVARGDGHEVRVAHCAATALQLLDSSSFDIVLSDIRMPGLGGPQFYERLKQSHPQMQSRVIFVTGDTLTPRVRAFLRNSGRAYLEKPVRPAELRDLLASVGTSRAPSMDGEQR